MRGAREVLIVGAGYGGQSVVRELRRNPELREVPIGFVDDDPRKQGMRIAGLKVLGTTGELARILDDAEPDEVIIAIPSAPGDVRQKVVSACRERAIPVRTLPTVFELLVAALNLMRQVREVQVEDVLGREPVASRSTASARTSTTRPCWSPAPAARSAPSCAARSHACAPRRLILVDNAENKLFEIRRELEDARHFRNAAAVLADCKDADAHARALHRVPARASSSTRRPTSTCR